jgi:hypothetical protein
MLAVWWRPLGGGWLRGGELLGGGVGDDLRGGLLTLGEGEGWVGEKEVLTKVMDSVGGRLGIGEEMVTTSILLGGVASVMVGM